MSTCTDMPSKILSSRSLPFYSLSSGQATGGRCLLVSPAIELYAPWAQIWAKACHSDVKFGHGILYYYSVLDTPYFNHCVQTKIEAKVSATDTAWGRTRSLTTCNRTGTNASSSLSVQTTQAAPSRWPDWFWTRGVATEKNIVLIFDENRLSYASGVIRSTLHFNDATDIRLHLITTEDAFNELEPLLDELAADATMYDYSRCVELTASLRPFSDPHIHTSALCKLFIAELLPSTIQQALYLDTDTTVTGPLDACTPQLQGSTLFAMSLDLGDACQIKPDRCWPLSLEFKPWPGLKCGNVPELHRDLLYEAPGNRCTKVDEPEPAQVNGGKFRVAEADPSAIPSSLDSGSRQVSFI